MFENTAIKIATTKLVSASLLPGSLYLMGGIVAWQLWRKQTKLQAETNELSEEFKAFKKQVTNDRRKTNSGSDRGADRESETSLSSSKPPFDSPSDKEDTPSKPSVKETTSTEKLGLFEYLINDNIQIRKQV